MRGSSCRSTIGEDETLQNVWSGYGLGVKFCDGPKSPKIVFLNFSFCLDNNGTQCDWVGLWITFNCSMTNIDL